MTAWRKRTITEMAIDAGFYKNRKDDWYEAFPQDIEAFAALVREEAIAETNAQANASWTLMCEKMVAIEREACAKLAQETICDTHIPTGINIYGTRAAKAIRARSNT